MKIIFVRHGDPDYEKDSLTKQGWIEAKCLSERLSKLDVKQFYVSPLGRAKDTLSLTLEKMGREATVCDWLQEFTPRIWRPDVADQKMIPWDWLPEDFVKNEEFYRSDIWEENPILKEGQVGETYHEVVHAFDEVLKDHGYEREGHLYRVKEANSDTLVFAFHFGLQCVLLSHLLNLPLMVVFHQFCAPPSSVTTIISEERRKGIAQFRMQSFGDTSHLYANGEVPSFAARFCECYDNDWERHD